MLALPSSCTKDRWGPKLLEYIQGEAEDALEHLSIEKVTSEKGYEDILGVLDDRYKELQQEALHRGLREYFYQVMIQPGEGCGNFMVRLGTSYRKLVQHGIELPEEVQGWFLMRKFGLDQASESMLLTATGGSLKKTEVVKAVKAIFPQGKGGNVKKTDVFVAEETPLEPGSVPKDMEPDEEGDDQNEVQEIFKIVAEQLQAESDYEEEGASDVFETYRDIMKKIQDKKVGRRFKRAGKGSGKGTASSSWQLQGSIRGKIELIKAKTRCHICKQLGHWRRECPQKNQNRARSSNATSTAGSSTASDVHYTDHLAYDEFRRVDTIPEVLAAEVEETSEESREAKKKDKGKKADDSTGSFAFALPRSLRRYPHSVEHLAASAARSSWLSCSCCPISGPAPCVSSFRTFCRLSWLHKASIFACPPHW